MGSIVDKRSNSKGVSSNNRNRFIKRVSKQIKENLPNIVGNNTIKDLTDPNKTVKVPVKGTKEPRFIYDSNTGEYDHFQTGNDQYVTGDKMKKPESGSGQGKGKGSNSPELGEDEFTIELSREEFLDFFFDDLELPNMIKKYLETEDTLVMKRSGYVSDGIPSRMNLPQSFKKSISRRIAMEASIRKKIKELEDKIKVETDPNQLVILNEELEKQKKNLKTIPFIDNVDLRYNHFDFKPEPKTKAAMFCIMDVSGSMGEHEKDVSKRFFMLLYLFLTKQYQNVDMVFIRHHTEAKEVDEKEFFESRETGGTIVLPALQLMQSIIKERYTEEWNIYGLQCSDGDTWNYEDAKACRKTLEDQLLKIVQYYIYLEISDGKWTSDLWNHYKEIKPNNFKMIRLYQINEIWQNFHEVFRKKINEINSFYEEV